MSTTSASTFDLEVRGLITHDGFGRLSKRRHESGSSLAAVLVVLMFLVAGLTTYLSSLSGIRKMQEQRIINDRALMAAEAGLARGISKLNGMAVPPTANTTWTMALPASDFAPFTNVAVNVYPEVPASGQRWTLASTATLANGGSRYRDFSRRVQATLGQQNFARYEYFVNDFGGVWSPGYLQFEGFGSVFFGPYHSNTGAAFWPNLWMLKETTTSAPNGVRTYADFSTYMAVYGDASAHSSVNILNYFNGTFNQAPKFYGGLTTLPAPISLPSDMNTDTRATQLRTNAGLKLPADYAGYDATKGPNFAIDISSPTSNPADSLVQIRQVLSISGGVATYGPTRSFNINTVNNSMIVYGNVKSLKGVLNGKLTIAAMKSTEVADAGNIDVTGNLEYASRKANPNFKYTDSPDLYTGGGSGINQAYVDTLMNQLNTVTDVLGLVAEKDVMIKERDLANTPIAANPATPLYIDAIVMATGGSTASTTDGGFGVENFLTRPVEKAFFLGGSIQNYGKSWALYNGSGVATNGIVSTRLWDQRAYKPGGAPPYFPSTGTLQFLNQSWRSTFVGSASDAPWLPN